MQTALIPAAGKGPWHESRRYCQIRGNFGARFFVFQLVLRCIDADFCEHGWKAFDNIYKFHILVVTLLFKNSVELLVLLVIKINSLLKQTQEIQRTQKVWRPNYH